MRLWKSQLMLIALVVMLCCSFTVSAVSDGTNDVWHQKWTGSGYSWEAYSGTKNNIDISDVSVSLNGNTATVTMTTVGSMTIDSENVVYTTHVTSGEDITNYMIVYTNGQGSVVGMGDNMGFVEQLENPISGNTLTASFEVSDPSKDYSIYGFNVEHSNIDDNQGEAWWDYAPNDYAPYYSGGDGTGGDDTGGGNGDGGDDEPPTPSTPGFEIIGLISAVAVAFILLKKKR